MTEKSILPLCVDLDGTLIYSDLLVESTLALFARKPWLIFAMVGWLLRGKAHLKRQIAERVSINSFLLPYNHDLIDWLRQQRDVRQVVLCTASHATLAIPVAEAADCFDEVMASDGKTNLSGRNKAKALVERFGERGFDYVGNARIDLAIWRHSRAAIVVEEGQRLSRQAARVCELDRRFERPAASFRIWLKALRIHQWIKNVLVFLPLLAAHRAFDPQAIAHAALAFLCFGLCASSVYLTNDLLDLTSDRQHDRKRYRPFAAGRLPLVAGPAVAVALLIVSFMLAILLLPPMFTVTLAGYYMLTTAYSFWLKRIVMLDVIVLALLYTTRILAGTSAIGVPHSFWLLAFSMFIFLSLAMVKRYTELLSAQGAGKVEASGRGYNVDDIPLIQSLGGSSGYLAVLVLALYIDSTASSALYRHPHYLWLLCPLLLYWISRTWAIAHRGVMHDDPVVFAVMDNTSRLLLLIAAATVAAAV